MASQFTRLTEEALSLAPAEKAALARVLIEDLDESHDPSAEDDWKQEVARRIAEYRAGRTVPLPGTESMAQLRKAGVGNAKI